jgi:hypothetical protein
MTEPQPLTMQTLDALIDRCQRQANQAHVAYWMMRHHMSPRPFNDCYVVFDGDIPYPVDTPDLSAWIQRLEAAKGDVAHPLKEDAL